MNFVGQALTCLIKDTQAQVSKVNTYLHCWPRLQMFVEGPQAQVSRVLRSMFGKTFVHCTNKKTRSMEGLERL